MRTNQILILAFLAIATLGACVGCDELSSPHVTCERLPTQFDLSSMVAVPVKDLTSADSRWVVMGSSSAAGAGAEGYRYSWAGQLQSYLSETEHELINIAKGGYVTYQALPSECSIAPARKSIDPEHNVDRALKLNPDVVIVSFPSNDAAVGYRATESAVNLLLMREAFLQHGVAMLVVSTQPRPLIFPRHRQLQKLDAILRPVFGSCYIDVFDALDDGRGELAQEFDYDTVHINRAGHDIVYQSIKEVLATGQCVTITHD